MQKRITPNSSKYPGKQNRILVTRICHYLDDKLTHKIGHQFWDIIPRGIINHGVIKFDKLLLMSCKKRVEDFQHRKAENFEDTILILFIKY